MHSSRGSRRRQASGVRASPARRRSILLAAACVALVAGVGSSARSASSATLPPALVALESKAGELKITTMRFSLRTSIAVPPRDHELLKLLKLLGLESPFTGELVLGSPPAGVFSFQFFTAKLTVRVVAGTYYLYLPQLGRIDKGRPWIELGPGGLDELLLGKSRKKSKSSTPDTSEPALAEPPFKSLFKTFAESREVRELGSSQLDGQTVTSFAAVLEPSQLESKALASTARRRVHNPPPVAPPPTLEASFAEDGVPVRTSIESQQASITTTVVLEIPAINFPLVIEAPPVSQTLSVAAYRKLVKQAEARARAHRHDHDKK